MNKKLYIVMALALLMPLVAGAQTLKGSYFLENSYNRNKLNPAFMPYTGYFQLPAIGGLNVGVMSNMGLSTFLYPKNDQIYTFLHKDISVDQFSRSLAKYPHLDINADINLINFGFFTGKIFWTFDTGLRVNADVDIPRDLFAFMKQGTGNGSAREYNIGALSGNAVAYAYAALGFSREMFIPGLRLGAKARVIIPAAYAGVNLDNVKLTTGEDKWMLDVNGTARTAMMGLSVMDAEGNFAPSVDTGKLGLAGMGFSFDLGLEYKLKFGGFINSLNFSAAVTDLGMVNYKTEAVNAYGTQGRIEWNGMDVAMTDEGSIDQEKIDAALKDIEEQAMAILDNVEELDSSSGLKMSTLPNFVVGVEMPFLKNSMSIGALYSARKSFRYTRQELTVSYNLTPARWFSLGVNYSFLNVDKTLGWIMEITPRVGPCLFIGSDYTFFEFAKLPENIGFPIIPMSMRFNFQFGLSFAIGGGKKAHGLVKKNKQN